MVDNIDKCMRFYPHQINCCGTFIAVIKKIREVDEQIIIPHPSEHSSISEISIVSNEILETIIKDFELSDECNKMHLVMREHLVKKQLFNLSPQLFNVITQFGFNNLRLCHAGNLAFTYIKNQDSVPFIPSVNTLPPYAISPKKQFIKINLSDFKEIVKNSQIQIDNLSMKYQFNGSENKNGGVYLMLDGIGALIGGNIKGKYITVLESRNELAKLYKIAKELLPCKPFHKKINYLIHFLEKTEKINDMLQQKIESTSIKLNQMQNTIAQNPQINLNTFNKEISALKTLITNQNKVIEDQKQKITKFENENENLSKRIKQITSSLTKQNKKCNKINNFWK